MEMRGITRKFVLPTEPDGICGTCVAVLAYNSTTYNKSSSVGLLACTTKGDLCYWEDVNLSTADEFYREKISMDNDGSNEPVSFVNYEVRDEVS